MRKSSSTRPRREQRRRSRAGRPRRGSARWPRVAQRARSRARVELGPPSDDDPLVGSRPASRAAPSSVVSTIAPAANAGWSGSTRPLADEHGDLGVAGRPSRRRSSANAVGRGGERLLGRPDRSRRGGQRPRADHERVGAGAQQPQHEPVGRAPAGDQLVRRGHRGIATTPSSVCDEVREHARLVEPERPAVEPRRARRAASNAGRPAASQSRSSSGSSELTPSRRRGGWRP